MEECDADAAPPAGGSATGVDAARFRVLAVYCAASFLCAGAWNTLAPIYEVAQARFDVSAGAVTLVSLTLFLTYVPGSVLALYVTERYGLRVNLLLGACLQTAMSVLKWTGVALCPAPHGAYALLLTGQVLGGLGQPLVLNVIARLTMDWCASRAGFGRAAPRSRHGGRRVATCAAQRIALP